MIEKKTGKEFFPVYAINEPPKTFVTIPTPSPGPPPTELFVTPPRPISNAAGVITPITVGMRDTSGSKSAQSPGTDCVMRVCMGGGIRRNTRRIVYVRTHMSQ